MASTIKVDKIAQASGTPEFTIPTADGTSGQFLKTDGNGVLSFDTVTTTALTGSTATWIPTITGANALTGTANLTYDGNVLDVKNSGTASSINLYCESSNAHYIKIKSGPHASATSYTLTMPNAPPSVSGQLLSATTAGVASWATDSGGGLKLISDTDFVGTASTFDVTDCFSATYRTYLVIMDQICVQLENASLYFYLGNSDLSSTENTSWELQMLGTNGTTDYKAAYGTGGQQLVYQQHNSNMGLSGTLWVHNPFGTGAGYITYTHGSGQVYANGTAEGFWFPRFAASHGTASVPSMRLSCAGGMGYSGITGHVLIYGLAES